MYFRDILECTLGDLISSIKRRMKVRRIFSPNLGLLDDELERAGCDGFYLVNLRRLFIDYIPGVEDLESLFSELERQWGRYG